MLSEAVVCPAPLQPLIMYSFLSCMLKVIEHYTYSKLRVGANGGLRLCEEADFGALHCQPAQKYDRSTQLHFCTSPPIEATRC